MKIKNLERYCLKTGIAHTVSGNTVNISFLNHTLKVFVFADGDLMVEFDGNEPEHWRENRLYEFLRNIGYIQNGTRPTRRFHRRHDGIVIVLKK
jgi:hypothetical protein